MSANKWVYRVSDGQLCMGAGPDPAIYLTDQVSYSLIDLGENAPVPNERTQRVVHATQTLRAATAPELAAFDATVRAAERDKDIAKKAIRALAIATHKRLKVVVPTDTTTAAQWEAAIRSEYDAL